MHGPHSITFERLKDNSLYHTHNIHVFQYVSLFLKDDTTLDLVIQNWEDSIELQVAIGSLLRREPRICSRQVICLSMVRQTLERAAKKQRLQPYQMIIRAIYRTTEETNTGIKDLDNMSVEDRIYWLQKMLRDVRTFNLEELVDTSQLQSLEKLHSQQQQSDDAII